MKEFFNEFLIHDEILENITTQLKNLQQVFF